MNHQNRNPPAMAGWGTLGISSQDYLRSFAAMQIQVMQPQLQNESPEQARLGANAVQAPPPRNNVGNAVRRPHVPSIIAAHPTDLMTNMAQAAHSSAMRHLRNVAAPASAPENDDESEIVVVDGDPPNESVPANSRSTSTPPFVGLIAGYGVGLNDGFGPNSKGRLYFERECMKLMYDSPFGKDFTFVSSDHKEFHCHSCIITAQLSSFMVARNTTFRQNRIQIPKELDIDGVSLDAFLRYIYYRESKQITASLYYAFTIAKMAVYAHVPELVYFCCRIIEGTREVGYFNITTLEKFRDYCAKLPVGYAKQALQASYNVTVSRLRESVGNINCGLNFDSLLDFAGEEETFRAILCNHLRYLLVGN